MLLRRRISKNLSFVNMGLGVTQESDALLSSPLVAHHSATKRTGTTWTAVAHIIT
ncbi:hypothetical protein ACS0TY_008685 [Phlomoides rotata]